MSVLGWFLAFVGFVGLIFGLLQMFKGKKMNAVPFRAPSQIAQLGAQAADAKGLVSTEGAVGQQGLLTAPMSGKPCLAFEITVERKWEKHERTENGMQKKTGSSNLFSDYKGGIFPLQDAQGTVLVDASQKPDATFEKSHSSGVNVGMLGIIPSTLQFGNFQMSTPLITGEGSTTGFEGIEKIIPPSPNLYALGALAATPQGPVVHTPKGIGTGKLILSSKGRAALAKSTKTKMIVGYAAGGVMFVGGTLLGIFGPAPDTSGLASSCSSTLASDVVSCDGRMYDRDGYDMKWTVTTAGEYTITAKQPKVKYPILATVTVSDATGKELAHDDGLEAGGDAKVKLKVEPGTYTINVRDFLRDKVKGGYGFHLDIARSPDAPAIASANVTSADVNGQNGTPAAKAAPAAVKGGAPGAAKAALPAKGGAAATATAAKSADAKAGDAKAGEAKAGDAKAGDAKPAASATGTAKKEGVSSTPPPAPAEPKKK